MSTLLEEKEKEEEDEEEEESDEEEGGCYDATALCAWTGTAQRLHCTI